MANGDYWNRGRGQEGFQKSSGLDFLERVLGITGQMAGRVQQRRNDRGTVLQSSIQRMIRNFNYKNSIDNDAIYNNLERRLERMKGEISNADIATQEFYNSITEDIKSHKLNNTEYKNLVKDINGIERKLYNFSDNYRKDQANIGSAEMGIRVEQIKKEANKYKEVKDYI